jgi:glycosyltransferase involved in cell wall biosynthesis
LSREKGPDVLLEAFADAEMPAAAHGVFLGDGPLMPELRERARNLGVDQRISWIGCVPGAGRLLGAFDVLVLSSRTEGTPMVILEGMAAGTPIVATAVGGVPDVLADGTGLLVPPESPSDLAKAIRNVLTNRTEATRRAQAARLRLEHEYRVDHWVERYEKVYQHVSVLAAKRLP